MKEEVRTIVETLIASAFFGQLIPPKDNVVVFFYKEIVFIILKCWHLFIHKVLLIEKGFAGEYRGGSCEEIEVARRQLNGSA
ncbi:MAG: hypothetical protein QXM14_02260 [Fervidicoccaceae archaeon]